MLISHKNLQLALPLSWSMAQDRAEVRAGSKLAPKAFRVVLPAGGRFWLGLYSGPVSGAAHAAALVVGLVVPTCIVCQTVSAEAAWICAIQDGMPVPLYDLLIPVNEARDRMVEWTHLFQDAEAIGDQPGCSMTLEEALATLDQRLADKVIQKKQLNAARLVRQSVSAAAIMKIVIVVALGAGGYLSWSTFNRVRLSEASKRLGVMKAAEAALNAKQTEEQKRKLVADFKAKVAAKRQEVEGSVGKVVETWKQWEAARHSVPISAFGFEPATLDCTTDSCRVAWAGSGPYTYATDKAKLPGATQDFDPALTATSNLPIKLVGRSGMQFPVFSSAEELRFRMLVDLSIVAPGLQVDPAQPVAVAPPPDLAPDLGLQPEVVGFQGKFKATFQGPSALILANDAMSRLARWPVMLLVVRYNSVNQVSSVDVEGSYTFMGGR